MNRNATTRLHLTVVGVALFGLGFVAALLAQQSVPARPSTLRAGSPQRRRVADGGDAVVQRLEANALPGQLPFQPLVSVK